MVYEYKANSRISVSAQVAGEGCENLAKSGGLTPKRLLDASRVEDAPLHNEFEWDDSAAAEAYRESQAAHIIRCIIIKPDDAPRNPVRAFVRVTEESGDYTPMHVVIKHCDMMERLMACAIKEMESFVRKYDSIKELSDVIESMNSILDKAG